MAFLGVDKMNYMESIIGECKDLVARVEITDKKLFVYLKSSVINTTEFYSICGNLSVNRYDLKSITTDDDNDLLFIFEYAPI